jgi:hypothetical protein
MKRQTGRKNFIFYFLFFLLILKPLVPSPLHTTKNK